MVRQIWQMDRQECRWCDRFGGWTETNVDGKIDMGDKKEDRFGSWANRNVDGKINLVDGQIRMQTKRQICNVDGHKEPSHQK